MLAKVSELRKEREVLQNEVKLYERSDPKILDKIAKDSKVSKDAINRWTDNLYQIMQWIQNSRPDASSGDLEK